MKGSHSPLLRDDPLVRARALLIARTAIAVYLVELLLNLSRPHLLPDEPALSIFYDLPGSSGSFGRLLSTPELVFWIVLVGIVVGAGIQIFAAVTARRQGGASDGGRRAIALTWFTLGCLLLPFGLISLTVVFEFFPIALLCVPSTVLVLLLLRAVVRFGAVSWTALLLAFAWGALIVFGLGRAYTSLAFGTVYGYLGPSADTDFSGVTDLSAFTKGLDHTIDLLIVHLGVVNECIVAAGVVLLLTLLRHRITDAVTGLVLGAAIGLGHTFVESVLIIKLYGSLGVFFGPTSGFEYWIRQSIGLLGGPVTFGALIGAGFGAAVGAQRRGRLVVASLVAAIGGAIAAEVLSGWLAGEVSGHVEVGSAFDTLVVSPFFWLLPQLPFIALAVALLVTGLRSRALVLRNAVVAETTAEGPITEAEAPVLVSPVLRFWAVVSTWRVYGRSTALALHRLQSAQLELASWRVRQDPETEAEGDELRARVIRGKVRLQVMNP
ncbi:PrsW family glutamic-type intramembrane protease [Streptomyces sp. CA-210063]|uniref:PrsW family glutamic-type intramembrane protease n=1 Tax=Streptomyces sp. CA-210063 TaxID=2801029 RepID=UPI00214B4E96|nr:PrsW family glutamic-type intramembrane protease [Streptomyces sp. CA-210063]UUU29828.1 PrsW family glutamic-type intramembrane protease [Streptomyces sp. CA-210063]